jgi:NDP-mannose synthase
MKAIILAGGKGTRLRPYTTVIPKPLVPVGEKAIIEILILRLKKAGIQELTLCVNHFAELIMAFLGDGKKYGLKIDYSLEDKPLSTVAPIKLIKDLPDHFMVMNGDLLTDLPFENLIDYHLKRNCLLTVATYKRNVKIDFGTIMVDPNSLFATGFQEKPTFHFEVSMGVYVFNKKVLDIVPDNQPFGFDNLMIALLKAHKPVNIYQYDGYWLDIGRPEDYEKAQEDLQKSVIFS